MKAALLVGIAAALLASAAGAAPTYVINGDRSFAGMGFRTTLTAAKRILGQPSALTTRPMQCNATWRNHGLRIEFFAFAPDKPCVTGTVLRASMTGARWRTSGGLRIGDLATAIKLRHPRATRRGVDWWLVTRKTCELGGFQPYGALIARTRGGRVVSFVFQGSLCE